MEQQVVHRRMIGLGKVAASKANYRLLKIHSYCAFNYKMLIDFEAWLANLVDKALSSFLFS